MRTTVTLDKDVEQMLREAMHRTRRSFKQTLNDSLRVALGGRTAQARQKPFILKARPMGLRTGIDPAGLNKLADELEVADFLEKAGGGQRA